MSRLTELLRQARKVDPQLGADLEAEFAALTKRRSFGLVFEQHQPEAVELPGRPVRRGDKVRVLPPRGETKGGDQRLWRVTRIDLVDGQRVAHLAELDAEEPETQSVVVDDVVVVAEFRDRIYPGLVETGRVERGGDKPFHTVINAENYHALEMLTYTHRHSIDAIYIDPPYNTGAKDWKYNNNYVEGDDDYRHSKWLAFMERRLKIARELLNPNDSVLIVTIDEKEYLRLGLLLEQTFPEADIQMVASMTNKKGSSRPGRFSRADEYLFVIYLGDAKVLPSGDNMLTNAEAPRKQKTIWNSLLRRGDDASRSSRPNMFYPVWVDPETEQITTVGDALPMDVDRNSITPPIPGLKACWPLRSDGSEGRWQVGAPDFARFLSRDTRSGDHGIAPRSNGLCSSSNLGRSRLLKQVRSYRMASFWEAASICRGQTPDRTWGGVQRREHFGCETPTTPAYTGRHFFAPCFRDASSRSRSRCTPLKIPCGSS